MGIRMNNYTTLPRNQQMVQSFPIGRINQKNGGGSSSSGSIISATDSGDHKNYTLAQTATTSAYYVIMNNGSYTTDDTSFGFSVLGTTLTFNSTLPSDLASTIIKLICV